MVPLLVRAQTEDADGGEAYTRRLITLAGVGARRRDARGHGWPRRCSPASTSAAAPAPPIRSWPPRLPTCCSRRSSSTAWARCSARSSTPGACSAPFAWAPVLNNVVVLAVAGRLRRCCPADISLDPVAASATRSCWCSGSAPRSASSCRRSSCSRRCAGPGSATGRCWGWDPRLSEAGGLAVWVSRTSLIGQAGYIVTTRVAAAADPGRRHDLRQRLAAAPGALRRPRRLAAHRADAADEPGRRRGAHRGRRRRPLARHPALRRRPAAGQPRCSRCSARSSASACSRSAPGRPARASTRLGAALAASRRSGCCRTRSRCCSCACSTR